ncbi:MAG: Transcriptional regulatory protein SrrA [Alphaproteobacteria bacterium MarineAlpha10_Bin1]|jgi:DNA-binding response OmpR family regulator|nr:MAG: Transcriptional regulatory protein SrrA [Alphaproteobacteria bacterium MarineAlpha10_Bin1]
MPDGKKPKILVIDDDDLVRATIVAVLERADVEVSEAADGDVGMRLFEEGAHDVVITDILMPNREGIETIRDLRRSKEDVKIIAISGGGNIDKMQLLDLAQKFGADRVLPKPFTPQQVLTTLDEVLAERD